MRYDLCQRLASSWKPGPERPGFFAWSCRTTAERLHRGIDLVEVNADQTRAAAVTRESTVSDHLPNGAVGDLKVLRRFSDFYVAASD